MRKTDWAQRLFAVLTMTAILVMLVVPTTFAETEYDTSEFCLFNDMLRITMPAEYNLYEDSDLSDLDDKLETSEYFAIASIDNDDWETIAYLLAKRANSYDNEALETELNSAKAAKSCYERYGKADLEEYCRYEYSSRAKVALVKTIKSVNGYFVKTKVSYDNSTRYIYWTCRGNVSMIIEGRESPSANDNTILNSIVAGTDCYLLLAELQTENPDIGAYYYDDEDDGWFSIIFFLLMAIISVAYSVKKNSSDAGNNNSHKEGFKKRKDRKAQGKLETVEVTVEPMHKDDECWGHEERSASYQASGTILEGGNDCFGEKSGAEIKAWEKKRKSRKNKPDKKKKEPIHRRKSLFASTQSTGLRLNGELYDGGSEAGVGVKLDGRLIDTSTEKYESTCGDYKANLDALYSSGLITIGQLIEMEEKYDSDVKRRGGR